jgi:hypothetical protein
MLPHFPDPKITIKHDSRDYIISAITFISITLALTYDGNAPFAHQKILALIAWGILISMLWGEGKLIRVQVMIAMIFATIGENFASLYMEGYIYRFNNIPAYIPAGHGIVYLTAVALGRSGFFQRYARKIAIFVVIIGGLWAINGISPYATRNDTIGAILFCIFLSCLFKGRSPMVYLGAFFITSWLEIIGTRAGTWYWVDIDPASGLSQGNPPSGVAAWYCLVDAVAMAGAKLVLNYLSYFSSSNKPI